MVEGDYVKKILSVPCAAVDVFSYHWDYYIDNPLTEPYLSAESYQNNCLPTEVDIA